MKAIVNKNISFISITVANVIIFDITVNDVQRMQLQQILFQIITYFWKLTRLKWMITKFSTKLNAIVADNNIKS